MSDKEFISIILGKGDKFPYTFENPRGSLVKCTVIQGKGKIVLMEDGKKVAGPYNLSLDPGKAYFVSLNTDRSPYYNAKCTVIIEGMGAKKGEKSNFLLELPLGKTQQHGRKFVTKRKVRKQTSK